MTAKSVLIVDDEKPLLMSLQEGFESFRDQFEVITAGNGQEAIDALHSLHVDLVVTDLRMPIMNGFKLLAYMSEHFSTTPVIIMTAFNTPIIEKQIREFGALTLIEKPIDFEELLQGILVKLRSKEDGAEVRGFSIAGFLQLVTVEKKTCMLKITTPDGKRGRFFINNGLLFNATYEDLKGEEAAIEMLNLKNVQINMQSLPKGELQSTIQCGLMSIIIRGNDLLNKKNGVSETSLSNDENNNLENQQIGSRQQKKNAKKDTDSRKKPKVIAVKEKLRAFRDIDGFLAVGVFSPQGEMMAEFNPTGQKLNKLGALANEVLLKSQKATEVMNTF